MMITNLHLLIVVRRGSYSVNAFFFLAAAAACLLAAAFLLAAAAVFRGGDRFSLSATSTTVAPPQAFLGEEDF